MGDDFANEIGLAKGLATGKGHAAAGRDEEVRGLRDLPRHLLRLHHPRAHTSSFIPHPSSLFPTLLSFGILAPGAPERAALQENSRARSRPVMQAELANLENPALHTLSSARRMIWSW